MKTVFTDHLKREMTVPKNPQRIISICPAITETLHALGVGSSVVGRTKYCIFPKQEVNQIAVVGGTKDPNPETVRTLSPDLILAEKEENTKEAVAVLEQVAPVAVLEVQTVEDSYRLIEDLGRLTGREEAAEKLVNEIQLAWQQMPRLHNKRALYMMWRKPYMVVGDTTYIQSVMEHLGLENAAKHLEGRYPAVTPELLQELKPDVVLLSSEPFPFSEKHQRELEDILPGTPSFLVDGEMFWYGSKMKDASPYFALLVDQLAAVLRSE